MIDLVLTLRTAYPKELADAVLAAYKEIESNFAVKKWKASELDAGHFVEGVRRIIEHTLFSTYTPIGKNLPKFTDSELKRYENASGAEEFRILIPRVLYSIYGIRNKRGVGHLGSVSPNEGDATLILYSAKWVLADLFRLASGMSAAEAQSAVEQVIARRLSVLWKHDGITRVLNNSMPAKDQVLLLLYDDNLQSVEQLQATIEYKNGTHFKGILRDLHKKRLIELRPDAKCMITPKGVVAAEEVLLKLGAAPV